MEDIFIEGDLIECEYCSRVWDGNAQCPCMGFFDDYLENNIKGTYIKENNIEENNIEEIIVKLSKKKNKKKCREKKKINKLEQRVNDLEKKVNNLSNQLIKQGHLIRKEIDGYIIL